MTDLEYELTLFVNGASERSARAIADVTGVCELRLDGRYRLAVVDVHLDPGAIDIGVLATPTLIKHRPLPLRRLVGDLSQTARVLATLDLPALEPR